MDFTDAETRLKSDLKPGPFWDLAEDELEVRGADFLQVMGTLLVGAAQHEIKAIDLIPEEPANQSFRIYIRIQDLDQMNALSKSSRSNILFVFTCAILVALNLVLDRQPLDFPARDQASAFAWPVVRSFYPSC